MSNVTVKLRTPVGFTTNEHGSYIAPMIDLRENLKGERH